MKIAHQHLDRLFVYVRNSLRVTFINRAFYYTSSKNDAAQGHKLDCFLITATGNLYARPEVFK
jgi:hypothetical protein